jgi:hypothetical protein
MSDEHECCTRCGDDITDASVPGREGDDLCWFCRYEADTDAEED